MINTLIESISVALNMEFGDDIYVCMEEIKQDLKEPCFFISCLNPVSRLYMGQRYFRQNKFCIQYFPETEERQRECNDIAERMIQCLEYINTSEGPVRGANMKYEVIDQVLNFFVNYDMFVYKATKHTPMEKIEISTELKGR